MVAEFVKKLSQLKEISPHESAALLRTFQNVSRIQKGASLYREGADQNSLFIVKSGWFCSYTILNSGSRQIHEIFSTGDVIGLENLSWMTASSSIACVVPGEVHSASLSEVRHLFQQHPNLDHLFQTIQKINTVLLIDRITAVSRLGAYNRIAFFLADTLAQQELVGGSTSKILNMPLSQTFITDYLGLSSVHVSRQFSKLVKAGLIKKMGGKKICIENREKLQLAGDFKNRFVDCADSFRDNNMPIGGNRSNFSNNSITGEQREFPASK